MSSCLTPTVTKRYPSAPSNTSAPCKMYDEYVPCDDCPDYPNGYPEEKCLTVNVNGKCWMAISMEDNNTSNPYNFIGKTDESGAWIVMEPCDLKKYMIAKATENFLTEEQIAARLAGKQNKLAKCGGGDIDDSVVQCNQMGSDFKFNIGTKQWGLLETYLTESEIKTLIESYDYQTITEVNKLIDGKFKKCGGDAVDNDLVQCDQMGAGIFFNPKTNQWESVSSSVPSGCQQFVGSIPGSFSTDLGTATPFYTTTTGDAFFEAHPPGTLSFSVADYSYLAEAGRKLCLKLDTNMAAALIDPEDRLGPAAYVQTGLWINMNGNTILRGGDGYYMNGDSQDYEYGTSNCVCFETTGEDLTFEAFRYVQNQVLDAGGNTIDYSGTKLLVDMVDISAAFFAGSQIITN